MDGEKRLGRRATDSVTQEKGGGSQEPQRTDRVPRKGKGSEREQKSYHTQALKRKGGPRRRSGDREAFWEWPAWGQAREGSVGPEVKGTSGDNTLFTGWYF